MSDDGPYDSFVVFMLCIFKQSIVERGPARITNFAKQGTRQIGNLSFLQQSLANKRECQCLKNIDDIYETLSLSRKKHTWTS